jgi:hypothetical protein
LTVNLTNVVFCQYKLWSQASTPVIVTSFDDNLDSVEGKQAINSIIMFNHEADYELELSEDMREHLADNALSIEVLSHRTCDYLTKSLGDTANKTALKVQEQQQKQKIYLDKLTELNRMAKYQSLVDSWSEVSKSFEINIKILELNSEGVWRPVEVKIGDQLNKTGGIYQLKQGQSRQISVAVSQVRQGGTMYYNGMLFGLEAHKIDKISIGCVQGLDMGLNPLDSYQELDLTRLKDKCRRILDNRKHYLHSQLKQQINNDSGNRSDDDKERYESLCKQLGELGEEQVALDAPHENSHLPGSTIKWTPADGMEEHVPILFLDLDESKLKQQKPDGASEDEEEEHDLVGGDGNEASEDEDEADNNNDEYFYDNEDYFESKNSNRKKRRGAAAANNRNVLLSGGKDCYLKNEHRDSSFVDLKLISWNDSTLVEMRDTADMGEDEGAGRHYTHSDEHLDLDEASLILKAVARWDSSDHKTIYLNKETPLDKRVYLIVKVTLRFRLSTSLTSGSLSLKSNKYHHHHSRHRAPAYHYVDLTMRKRVCVNVYSSSSTGGLAGGAVVASSSGGNTTTSKLINFTKLKTILSVASPTHSSQAAATSNTSISGTSRLATASTLTSTGVTYRLIATIPKLITEIENRESLAVKLASSILEETSSPSAVVAKDETSKLSLDNSMAYFEQYAKTIEAVDTILKRDRLEQQLVLKKLINHVRNVNVTLVDDEAVAANSSLATVEYSSSTPSMKKNFSVPNLFKNVSR